MKRLAAALAILAWTMTPRFVWAAESAVTGKAPSETAASLQAERLLEDARIENETEFREAVKRIYPVVDFATAEWTEMRGHLASLQVHGILVAGPTHAEISVFNPEMNHWMKAVIDVTSTEPHTITAFGLRMASRPADVAAPPKLGPEELAAATRTMVADEVAQGRFSGAVLIARGDEIVLSAAYGLADAAIGKPNTVTTQFRFGSVGKMFTAVAIMQLAQAGKLDLDAPIGRYLTDYPNTEIATKVTVNELLTHSGGTGDIFGPGFNAHRDTLRSAKDYVALHGARPPLFPPGSRQDYSNYGFILLGRIVEVVSGLDFHAYLQRHIFAPAGMLATGMAPEDVVLPNRAVGYSNFQGRLEAVTAASLRARGERSDGYMEYRGGPAGGGYSTVGDFLKFARAFKSHRFLDAEYTNRLSEGVVDLSGGQKAHYDFGGPTGDGKRFVGHGGAAPGQSADFRIYPDGYTVVVLANRDFPISTRIMAFIADRLP